MATETIGLPMIKRQAESDEGIFGDHLRRVWSSLERDPNLREALGNILSGGNGLSASDFYRLRSAGVLAGDSPQDARARCELYARYLKKRLL